jgi:hypothetical protein
MLHCLVATTKLFSVVYCAWCGVRECYPAVALISNILLEINGGPGQSAHRLHQRLNWWPKCWVLVALRLARLRSPRWSLRPSLLVSLRPPRCALALPSGPRGASVPSGPFGVPPYPPVCPPVPLVPRGSYSMCGPRPLHPLLVPCCPLSWLSSLAVAHACTHTQQWP